MEAQRKDIQLIDLGKFIASIGVLAIHECIFSDGSYANRMELRIYSVFVPFFFAVSAYLFFRKTQTLPFKEACVCLLKFCKRIGILYFLWLMVYLILLPHLEPDFLNAGFVKQLFFGHTFFGSWYLSALLVGTVLMFFLSRVSYGGMIVVGCLFYCYMGCCREHFLPIEALYDWYATNVKSPVCSFPSAVPHIALGAAFAAAEKKDFVKYVSMINAINLLFFLSMFFVSDEYRKILFWITHFLGVELCVYLCCRCTISYQLPSLTLRRMSIIIYFSHIYFREYLPPARYLWDLFSLKFPVVLLLTLLFSYGVVRLSEKKPFTFLRYFY